MLQVTMLIRCQEARGKEDERFSTPAVYLDDEQAGYTLSGNVFTDVDLGVLVGQQHSAADLISCVIMLISSSAKPY